MLWRPVLAGLWHQRETHDGTYDVHDLIEINRVLDIRDENQRRSRAAAEEASRRR